MSKDNFHKSKSFGGLDQQQELFIIESWALFYHQSTLNMKLQVTYYYGQLLDNSKKQNQINYSLKMIKNTCKPPQGMIGKNITYVFVHLKILNRNLINWVYTIEDL